MWLEQTPESSGDWEGVQPSSLNRAPGSLEKKTLAVLTMNSYHVLKD